MNDEVLKNTGDARRLTRRQVLKTAGKIAYVAPLVLVFLSDTRETMAAGKNVAPAGLVAVAAKNDKVAARIAEQYVSPP